MSGESNALLVIALTAILLGINVFSNISSENQIENENQYESRGCSQAPFSSGDEIVDDEIANEFDLNSSYLMEPHSTPFIQVDENEIDAPILVFNGETPLPSFNSSTIPVNFSSEFSYNQWGSEPFYNNNLNSDSDILLSQTSSSPGKITVSGRFCYYNIKHINLESLHYYSLNKNNNVPSIEAHYCYEYGARSLYLHFSLIQLTYVELINIYNMNNNVLIASYKGPCTHSNFWLEAPTDFIKIVFKRSTLEGYASYGFKIDMIARDYMTYGIKWATVEVWDRDPSSDDDLLWRGITDINGYFTTSELNNVDNDFGSDGGTQDIYAVIRATSSVCDVDYVTRIVVWVPYQGHTSVRYNVPNGAISIGTWSPDISSTSSENPAWISYDTIMDGYNFMRNGPANWDVPKVKVGWMPNHDASFLLLCPSYSHYHGDYAWINRWNSSWIHLNSEDGEDRDVILHEYGHHIMFHVYWRFDPHLVEPGGEHGWQQRLKSDLAWWEGWADFFFAPVQKWCGRGNQIYHQYYIYFNRFNVLFEYPDVIDLEKTPTWIQQPYNYDNCESTIAKALYDIYDSNNDGIDNFCGGFWMIWKALCFTKADTFEQWWKYCWKTCFGNIYYNIHFPKAALYQNGIDYNSAPWASNLQITSSPINGYYHGLINLKVKIGDADPEDSLSYLRASFYYEPVNQPGARKLIASTPYNGSGWKTISWDSSSFGSGKVNIIAVADDQIEKSSEIALNNILIDNSPPSIPTKPIQKTEPAVNTWTNDNTIYVSWRNWDDKGGSGVAGYSFEWSTSATTLPDAKVDTTDTKTTSARLYDGEWYLHIRAVDNVGNWATIALHVGPFKIDTVKPSNPTSFTSQPPVNTWTNDNTIYVIWSGATDSLSGIAGYLFLWTQDSASIPDEKSGGYTAASSTTSGKLTDGAWYLHIRSQDNAGNLASGAYHVGPFLIDTSGPSKPGKPTFSDSDLNDGIFTLSWTASTDMGSGIAGYELQMKIAGGNWITLNDELITVNNYIIPYTPPGIYYFRVMAVDLLGNEGPYSPVSNAVVIPESIRLTINSAISTTPDIAIDSHGNYHIVWVDNRDGNNEIYYKVLDENWLILIDETRLTNDPADSISPAIAISPSGIIKVVWADNRTGIYQIYVKTYVPGIGWTQDALLNPPIYDPTEFCSEPNVIADNQGNFYYTWAHWVVGRPGAGDRLMFMYQMNDGQPTVIYQSYKYEKYISIQMALTSYNDAQMIHVVFCEWDRTAFHPTLILYMHTLSDGSWSEAIPLDTPRYGTAPTTVSIDACGRYLIIAWKAPDANEIHYVRCTMMDANTVLVPHCSILETPSDAIMPSVGIASDGTTYIVWSDLRNGQYELYYTKSRVIAPEEYTSWSTQTRLTTAAGDSLYSSMCVNKITGKVAIVWSDARDDIGDGNREIYFTAKYI